MTLLQTILLAIIEGLTEFLPVSSTAHMRFANPLIGVHPDDFIDMFQVVIQFAAMLSVVTIYWRKFFDIKRVTFYGKLIVAVIPALIGGFFLKTYIGLALNNLMFIAIVMISGGVALLFVDRFFSESTIHEEKDITYTRAFIIGCFQVLSIVFPGLSRSAATIIGGMSQRLSRSLAAEFSFFLAVPTMFAASAKSFLDVYNEHPNLLGRDNYITLGIGAVVSYLVALLAIELFIGYLKKHGFKVFGWYRIALGSVVLILLLTGHMQ